MMKGLWAKVNKLKCRVDSKIKVFLMLLCLVNMIIGGLLWLFVGRIFLPELSWLFCFIGYPAVIVGLFGGSFYLYKHEFN